MSYKQFVADLNKFYKNSENKGIHYEVGQTVIRDIWIKNGRYDELIDFILENWDSGNCDDFIEPLENILIKESHISRFKRLWKRIIYYRLEELIDTLKDYKKLGKTIIISELDKMDISTFNMFSVESYNDIKKVLAFRRNFLLNGIEKYKKGLAKLNDNKEYDELLDFELAVRNLDNSKLKTGANL